MLRIKTEKFLKTTRYKENIIYKRRETQITANFLPETPKLEDNAIRIVKEKRLTQNSIPAQISFINVEKIKNF